MVIYDDEANGYRHQILPLAHCDPVVERAICTAAAFHLSQRSMPELRLPAERARAAIISKLSQSQTPDLSESTWATIILLIVSDLVTGHEQVLVLYKMLVAFMKARDEGASLPTSALGVFLNYQSRIISFFASPMLGESTALADFCQVSADPLGSLEKYSPRRQALLTLTAVEDHGPTVSRTKDLELADARTQLYSDINWRATQMYLLRASSASSPGQSNSVDAVMLGHVAGIRVLLEQVDPASPGAHTLVWPIFVAAAEARTRYDRNFFSAALRRIWDRTGYANVLRGLEALPGIWASQASKGPRWTAALPELKTVVM